MLYLRSRAGLGPWTGRWRRAGTCRCSATRRPASRRAAPPPGPRCCRSGSSSYPTPWSPPSRPNCAATTTPHVSHWPRYYFSSNNCYSKKKLLGKSGSAVSLVRYKQQWPLAIQNLKKNDSHWIGRPSWKTHPGSRSTALIGRDEGVLIGLRQ